MEVRLEAKFLISYHPYIIFFAVILTVKCSIEKKLLHEFDLC